MFFFRTIEIIKCIDCLAICRVIFEKNSPRFFYPLIFASNGKKKYTDQKQA